MNDVGCMALLCFALLFFVLGLPVGFSMSYQHDRAELCKALYTQTEGYYKCIDTPIEDVFKQIRKVDNDK